MLEQIPLFAMLKAKMGYDTTRQRVISTNVANADTPGYAPSDLKAFDFPALVARSGIAPVRTNAAHIAGRPATPRALKPVPKPDSEARLDGNQVVLEEQMMHMNEAAGDYDTAVTLYMQSLTLLRTAATAPGK